jgi:hypothetical protein
MGTFWSGFSIQYSVARVLTSGFRWISFPRTADNHKSAKWCIFFRKFAKIFAMQDWLPMSRTLLGKFVHRKCSHIFCFVSPGQQLKELDLILWDFKFKFRKPDVPIVWHLCQWSWRSINCRHRRSAWRILNIFANFRSGGNWFMKKPEVANLVTVKCATSAFYET